MNEEWKKEFFEWKDEIESKFNNLSQKHSELEEWNEKAKKVLGRILSKLFKKVFSLNHNALINTRITKEQIENETKSFINILDDSKVNREVLRQGYTCLHNYFLAKEIRYYQMRFKQMLEMLDSPKKKHIASLNDPKAFEAVNLGVLKRERKGSGDSKKPYLDLGMIKSKNGNLSDYTPSQFVKDYAKTHTLFSLYGLMFPEEDSGGDSKTEGKEDTIKICPECGSYYKGTHTLTDCNYAKGDDSGGELSVEVNNPMSSRSGMKASITDSKLSEHICTLKEQNDCDQEGSMECLKGKPGGIPTMRVVCIHGKKELEKLPEPLGEVDRQANKMFLEYKKWEHNHKLELKEKKAEPEKESIVRCPYCQSIDFFFCSNCESEIALDDVKKLIKKEQIDQFILKLKDFHTVEKKDCFGENRTYIRVEFIWELIKEYEGG